MQASINQLESIGETYISDLLLVILNALVVWEGRIICEDNFIEEGMLPTALDGYILSRSVVLKCHVYTLSRGRASIFTRGGIAELASYTLFNSSF